MRVLLLMGLLILVLSACGDSDSDDKPTAVNPDAPVLQSIGNKTVMVGSNLNFQILATDPNSENLTYRSTPSSFYSRASSPAFSGRSFNWDPSSNDLGTYSVTFTVENSPSELQDSETIVITVTSATASNGEALFNANCTGSGCHGGAQACAPWSASEITDALPGGANAVSAMSGINLSSGQISGIADYAAMAFNAGC